MTAARDFDDEWEQITLSWERAIETVVRARVTAAYEKGRNDEHGRNREFIADLISGLLRDWPGGPDLIRLTTAHRMRLEKTEMVASCHALAAELGRPRGYVWRGTERGDRVSLTPDGNWPDTEPRQDTPCPSTKPQIKAPDSSSGKTNCWPSIESSPPPARGGAVAMPSRRVRSNAS